MPRPEPSDVTLVVEASDAVLASVLTDLDLGLTFLDVAETTRNVHDAHRNVRNAIATLRTANKVPSKVRLDIHNVGVIMERRDQLAERLRAIMARAQKARAIHRQQ